MAEPAKDTEAPSANEEPFPGDEMLTEGALFTGPPEPWSTTRPMLSTYQPGVPEQPVWQV
ncbi:hypothetical protein D3C83_280260 [compost metagenome]